MGIFRQAFFVLSIVVTAVPLAGPATANDRETCIKESGDVAMDACSRAIASGEFSGKILAGIYADRGFEYRAKVQYDRAIADYTQAIQLDPQDLLNNVGRGTTYLYKGDHDRAVADYRNATRLKPKNEDDWGALCWARTVLGDLLAALANCNESLRLRPNDGQTLHSRGIIYLKLGQLDKALVDFNSIVRLDAKDPDGLYARGITKQKMGDTMGGETDVAAAKSLVADIAKRFANYGVGP